MDGFKKAARVQLHGTKIERSTRDKYHNLEMQSLECEVVSANLINIRVTTRLLH